MAVEGTGKADPRVWLPVLDGYELTTLPGYTILKGSLAEGLDPEGEEVDAVRRSWPGRVYVESPPGRRPEIVVVYDVKARESGGLWLHGALLVATLVTTLGAGALMRGLDPFSTRTFTWGPLDLPYPTGLDAARLWVGASFALPFLGVLGVHEFAHVFAARRHGVRTSLPYFIPFPPYFSIIGSLGAFIRLRSPTVRRHVLFDIGASGPLASFACSLPLFAFGLSLSSPVAGSASLTSPFMIHFAGQTVFLGNGLAAHAAAALFAPVVPGDAMLLLHPLALVGWLGLFVSALNLLPVGQLDGGHITYAMFGEHQIRLAKLFLWSLIPLGWLWWGWWAWLVVVLFVHRGRVSHPRVALPEPTLSSRRMLLGWVMILTFLLTFTPVPVAF